MEKVVLGEKTHGGVSPMRRHAADGRIALDNSEKIQHAVQIDSFPNMDLVLGFGQVAEQEFKDHGAAKAAAFDLEV